MYGSSDSIHLRTPKKEQQLQLFQVLDKSNQAVHSVDTSGGGATFAHNNSDFRKVYIPTFMHITRNIY